MLRRLRCYLFGHRPIQLPYEDAPNGWFWERYKCLRCGMHRRELVAGKLG